MIDKSDGRDWEKEAAEAVICLNCTKPNCNGSPECFRKQAKRHKTKKSGGNSGNCAEVVQSG